MTKKRVVIENIKPQVDQGRFPAKRVVGDTVSVEADIFTDGHDEIAAILLYRRADLAWREQTMVPVGNDHWTASFETREIGFYYFTVEAWIDHFRTWQRDLRKKVEAEMDISVDLLIGSQLIEKISSRANERDRGQLIDLSEFLKTKNDLSLKVELALDEDLAQLVYRYPDKDHISRFERELPVWVDRKKACFSTWYEMFPRSFGEKGEHGTFEQCEKQLPEIARMGFDVLYLPPIHPIGGTKRKGPNNAIEAGPEDPGSPWAIGGAEGGHKAIHPELGTVEDFRRFVEKAKELGIEVALDLAFQCSPDHPYVEKHPDWFRARPDGSVQYAENPPKKYEDIYPFDFEGEATEELWEELKSIFEYWIEQGISIFRVDNPHTKPFDFWEWAIAELRLKYPELILLAEAFTRPKIMYRLGKLGFAQSYTYFAWRNSKWELTEYFHQLTQTEVSDYFRPNAWPNTPDILTEYLQTGGRPAFLVRLILAATLCSNYGIYGPAFELCENEPRGDGSEEYLDSEKYQIRSWNLEEATDFRDLIARINQIRRAHPALQINDTLRFHHIDTEQLISYSKRSIDNGDLVITVVNLDPHHTQGGWLELPLEDLGIDADKPFQVHDLLDGSRFLWMGPRNYVEVSPHVMPAHIFKVRRKVRTEHDFEYYL